jgi:hypothetical protein
MSNPPKFLDLPTGYVPANRRVYDLAKMPFLWLWIGLTWLALPFLQAFVLTTLASTVMNVFLHVHAGSAFFTSAVAHDIFAVAVVWAVYLGAVFLVFKVLGALRNL